MSVNVSVVEESEWKDFLEIGHLMSVAKKARLLIPRLRYTVTGFETNKTYKMSVQFVQVDQFKYIRRLGQVKKTVIDGELHHSRIFPCGWKPQTGGYWLKHGISFINVHLTNDESSTKFNEVHVFLRRKYTPVLTIEEEDGSNKSTWKFEFLDFITVSIQEPEKLRAAEKRKSIKHPDQIQNYQAGSICYPKNFAQPDCGLINPNELPYFYPQTSSSFFLLPPYFPTLFPNFSQTSTITSPQSVFPVHQNLSSILLNHSSPTSSPTSPPVENSPPHKFFISALLGLSSEN